MYCVYVFVLTSYYGMHQDDDDEDEDEFEGLPSDEDEFEDDGRY